MRLTAEKLIALWLDITPYNLVYNESLASECGLTNYISVELSQDIRNKVFVEFKNSQQRILISTDVSARGIDIQGIELVINFDLPQDNATYYHRIGRAGRFGRDGKAVSIVSEESNDQSVFKKSIASDRINKLTLGDL